MDPNFARFAAVALVLVGALLVAVIMALWMVYQRLSRGISDLKAQLPGDAVNAFTQLESLLALQQRLNFKRPLPRTRGWAASPDFLRIVMEQAMDCRPDVVVECSSGISTLILARCAQLSGRGHVHSLEHDPEFAQKTRDLLAAEGLDRFATVYDAPLIPLQLPGWSATWYDSKVLPAGLRIGMLVVDGPPWFVTELPRYPAVPVFLDAFEDHALVLLDDASRPAERACVKRWRETTPHLTEVRLPPTEKGVVGLRLQLQGQGLR